MKKDNKNNVVNFPNNSINGEREVEAILFAAAEPLDLDTIEAKVKKNLLTLNCINRSDIFDTSVTDFINQFESSQDKFDFIFLDPPYKEQKINILLEVIIEKKILNKNGVLILHRNKKTDDIFSEKLKIFSERIYGLSKIYFIKL